MKNDPTFMKSKNLIISDGIIEFETNYDNR